eukprot:scaffold17023_cov32-Tisochrysis_lutea.AAC.1
MRPNPLRRPAGSTARFERTGMTCAPAGRRARASSDSGAFRNSFRWRAPIAERPSLKSASPLLRESTLRFGISTTASSQPARPRMAPT